MNLRDSPREQRRVLGAPGLGWRLLIPALIAMAGLVLACKPGASGSYQLRRGPAGPVILPPPYWGRSAETPVRLTVPLPLTQIARRRGCSISTQLFKLRLSPASLSVALPSLRSWRAAILAGNFRVSFDRFLDQIDSLDKNGCLTAGESAALIEAMRESVPARMSEVLDYRYDYGTLQEFMNLSPGMRLKIQREIDRPGGRGPITAYYRAPNGSRRKVQFTPRGRFAGTVTVYYRILRGSHREIDLRRSHVESTLKARPPADPKQADLRLGMLLSGMSYDRLVFLGEIVPTRFNYAAIVLGARDRATVNAATEAVKKREAPGCPPKLDAQRVRCAAIQGPVSATIQFGVRADGKMRYEYIGETVGMLLRSLSPPCRKSVRIDRRFLNRFAPVVFDPSDPSIFTLPLVPGDRVWCSQGHIP